MKVDDDGVHSTKNTMYSKYPIKYLFLVCNLKFYVSELGGCCVWVDSAGSLTTQSNPVGVGGTTPITGPDGVWWPPRNPTLLLHPLLTPTKPPLLGPFSILSLSLSLFSFLHSSILFYPQILHHWRPRNGTGFCQDGTSRNSGQHSKSEEQNLLTHGRGLTFLWHLIYCCCFSEKGFFSWIFHYFYFCIALYQILRWSCWLWFYFPLSKLCWSTIFSSLTFQI